MGGQGQHCTQGFILWFENEGCKITLEYIHFYKKEENSGLKSKVSFGDKDYSATIEQDVSEAAPLSSTRDASPCTLGYCA